MKSAPVLYQLVYCILFTCFLPIKASRIGGSLLLFAPSFSNPLDWKACSTDLDSIGKCIYGSWVFSITFIYRPEDKIWVQWMKDGHMKVPWEEKNCLVLEAVCQQEGPHERSRWVRLSGGLPHILFFSIDGTSTTFLPSKQVSVEYRFPSHHIIWFCFHFKVRWEVWLPSRRRRGRLQQQQQQLQMLWWWNYSK